jgi:hypothetical protein
LKNLAVSKKIKTIEDIPNANINSPREIAFNPKIAESGLYIARICKRTAVNIENKRNLLLNKPIFQIFSLSERQDNTTNISQNIAVVSASVLALSKSV